MITHSTNIYLIETMNSGVLIAKLLIDFCYYKQHCGYSLYSLNKTKKYIFLYSFFYTNNSHLYRLRRIGSDSTLVFFFLSNST